MLEINFSLLDSNNILRVLVWDVRAMIILINLL